MECIEWSRPRPPLLSASESSSDEEDNNISESKFAEQQKIMVRLKEFTKIDYGIWAYDKISCLKDSHWIKQPKLFQSAVTVIGGGDQCVPSKLR